MKKVLSIGAAVAVSGTLAYSAEAGTHIVDKGDTLSEIVHQSNTTVDAIKKTNKLTSNLILPGQELEITQGNNSEDKEAGEYKLKSGDTLFEIAQNFDVSVSDLKTWNNLSSDLIIAGKTLLVSGDSTTQVTQAPVVEEVETLEVQAPAQVQQAEENENEGVADQAAEERQQTKTQNVSTSSNSSSQNWGALAQCESGGAPGIVSSNGLYHGLYQFDVRTWQAVGGSGLPSNASAAEQTKRAQILYDQKGSQPWPVCGSRL